MNAHKLGLAALAAIVFTFNFFISASLAAPLFQAVPTATATPPPTEAVDLTPSVVIPGSTTVLIFFALLLGLIVFGGVFWNARRPVDPHP